MKSLRARLWLVWLLSLLASAVLAGLALGVARNDATARVERLEALMVAGCDRVRQQVAFYAAGDEPARIPLDRRLTQDMGAVLTLALRNQSPVTAGIWFDGPGTIVRRGPALDLDPATLTRAARAALAGATTIRLATRTPKLRLVACPLTAAFPEAAAWLASPEPGWPALRSFAAALAVLLALVAGIAVLVGRTLLVWNRGLGRIEASLASVENGHLPILPPSGERELDRIVTAFNQAGIRLDDAQARAGRAERLASLGRVAAGLAHEIRNPIASLRLRAENALAGDDDRRRRALADSLAQIARVESLVAELLSLATPRRPEPVRIAIAPFLAARIAEHREPAEQAGAALSLEAPDDLSARFDPVLIGRALDNLIANAIRHAPGGHIAIAAWRPLAGGVAIRVADDGPGVPLDLRTRLFEPFATGRPDGTGLGLAVARDILHSHGGSIELVSAARGASFLITLPATEGD